MKATTEIINEIESVKGTGWFFNPIQTPELLTVVKKYYPNLKPKHIISDWECEKSPIGCCIQIKKPWDNIFIFCENPE